MDNKREILILAFVGDDHLDNVKSLQSMFNQSFSGMHIVLCNNATNAFQCERLIFNITDHTPSTVNQIQIEELPHPMDELSVLRRLISRTDSDFVFVLHAGEQFSSAHFLDTSALVLGSNPSIDVLAVSAEECRADSNAVIRTLSLEDSSFLRSSLRSEGLARDCMFVYRKSALQEILDQEALRPGTIWSAVVPVFCDRDAIDYRPALLSCKFHEGASENAPFSSVYGNVHLNNIKTALQAGAAASSSNSSHAYSSCSVQEISRRQKCIAWLYKHSRLQKMKTDLLILLLLLVLASVLFVHRLILPVAYMLFAAAFLAAAWLIFMLLCNLYFKKHPERLVNNNA